MVHPGPDLGFSVHDVFTGWQEALRGLGVEVAGYNLNDRLIFYSSALIDTGRKDEHGAPIVRQAMTQEQAFLAASQGLSHALYSGWPDVVLFVSAFFMTERIFRLIKARGHKIIILHTESPYQDDDQLARGNLADLNLLNDPVNLDKFRETGPAEYQHHCYRPSVHHPRAGPLDPELASDFAFVGTAFKSRIDFFSQLDLDGLDVFLAGNDWGKLDVNSPLARYIATGAGNEADCLDNEQAAEVYRNSRMGLNFYRQESEDSWDGRAYAIGPREIEMAACQLPFIRDPRAEGDEVFSMLPVFRSPEEASDQLRYWISHDREREKIAVQAREAIADRTFENSARRLLRMIENL
jgi:spore maturation protein CgeB